MNKFKILRHNAISLLKVLCIIAPFSLPLQTLSAAPKKVRESSQSILTKAASSFKSEDYDKAVTLYRRYLKRRPKDHNVWNNLAASYYHVGVPARAIRYLRLVEKKTQSKSYNFYYQGLANTALGKYGLARKKFTYAARFTDEYAARATFELAVLDYNSKNYGKANYWINLYLQRYPSGVFSSICRQMADSIRRGIHIPGLTGNKKPDMDKALYRYHKHSLSPNPHYWFFQAGSLYNAGTGKEPSDKGTIKSKEFADYSLNLAAGVGYGPVKKGDSLAFGGYTYRQIWNTETSRIETFLDDFDPGYFPFQGDIMERSHELYGDYRHKIRKNIFGGVFARKEFRFGGSDLLPGPDQPDNVKATVSLSDTTLFIPWVGISYLDNFYTLAYLYFRKEINSQSFDLSNKTYSVFGNDDFTLSYGISHSMEFPRKKLKVVAEAFLYEFIYNDYWLDYTRLGFIAGGEYEFYPRFSVRGLVGTYTDNYILDRFKKFPCSFSGEKNDSEIDDVNTIVGLPQACPRVDTGMLVELGGAWEYSQFHRVEGRISQVSNESPQLKIFDRTKLTMEVRLTWAFPSADKVIRYVDRFADSAFTKEIQ
ncbi:tetratricopeptide repeat protein [Oligoflexaceae bacterium]|nr:tetratricopeptide repeat protein [Oligoflexaceae bacterium]